VNKRAFAPALATLVVITFVAPRIHAAGATTSTAAEYAQTFCTKLGTWQKDISDGEQAVQSDLDNASSVADIKKTFVQFLDDAVSSGKGVVAALKSAGSPDVKDGAVIATAVRSAFGGIVTVFDHARSDAKKLSPTSQAKFTTGVKKIQTTLATASTQFTKQFSALSKKYETTELDAAFNAEPSCSALA